MQVFYVNKKSQRELKSFLMFDLFPFPAAYSELDVIFNRDSYEPEEKSIDVLKKFLERENASWEKVSKRQFFVKDILLPYMNGRMRFTDIEWELAQYLHDTLNELRCLHLRCFSYLRDEIYSKEKEVEKKLEKRRRYKKNKNKRKLSH